jgi:hypothetical protein
VSSIFSVEMKLKTLRSYETSAFKTTRSYNKDCSSHFHLPENSKSHSVLVVGFHSLVETGLVVRSSVCCIPKSPEPSYKTLFFS